MPAAYDSYDYPAYWEGRDYEHKSELIALNEFLNKIPKIETLIEVGAGYGRLASSYAYRAKNLILTDPSAKLLSVSRKRFNGRKRVRFVQSTLENLPEKLNKGSVDLVIMVRVLHHLTDLNKAFTSVKSLLKKKGYFILEFPNKRNLKVTIAEFLRGNLTFSGDIFSKDMRSLRSIRRKTLPFFNYHPDFIKHSLELNGFNIIKCKSVSNIRSPFIKKIVPVSALVSLEKYLQDPLSYFNFGPSVFILAQKSV